MKQPEYQAGNKPRASHRRASRRPPGALGSPLVLQLACLAAARGPGRPGLQQCRQGGLACPAGDRFQRGRRLGRLDACRCWYSGSRDLKTTEGHGGAIAALPAVPGALGSPLAMQQAGAVGCRYAGRRNVNKVR